VTLLGLRHQEKGGEVGKEVLQSFKCHLWSIFRLYFVLFCFRNKNQYDEKLVLKCLKLDIFSVEKYIRNNVAKFQNGEGGGKNKPKKCFV
jgi:hypothetical protein